MGVYLSSPIRDKVSEDDELAFLRYGASSMQGWRTSQEDAHNCCPNFDPENNTTLFACYDGHGGAEVAQYTAQHLPDYLKKLESYKSGNYSKALEEGFLGFDATLKEEAVIQRLKELAGVDEEPDEGDGNHDEKNALYEEATMPLEELLSRYGRGGAKSASILNKDQKFESPALTAKKENGSSGTAAASSARPEKDSVRMKLENELMNGHSDNENNENIERAAQLQQQQQQEGSQANEAQAKEQTDSNVKSENGKTGASSNEGSSSCVDSTTPDENTQQQKASNIKDEQPEAQAAKNNIKNTTDTASNCKDSSDEVIKFETNNEAQQSTVNSNSENAENKTKSEDATNGSSSEAQPSSTSSSLSSSQPAGSSTSAGASGSSSGSSSHSMEPESSSSSSGGSANSTGSSGSGSAGSSSSAEQSGPCSSSEEPEAGSSTGRMRHKRKNIIPEEGEDESSFDEDEESSDDEEEGAEPWAESGSDNSSDEDVMIEPEDEDEEDDEEEEEDEDAMTGGEEPGADSGCTSVVALLKDRNLYVANAGDSRCVLCRGGKAVDMSIDHKPEDEVEHDRITKAGGRVTMDGRVNGGLNLSRAIGDHCYKRNAELSDREQMITALPDVRSTVLQSNDQFMVLACDGIWNVMTSQDVVNFVAERLKGGVTKLSSICEEMFDFCLSPDTSGDCTGCDNMTCIIVCFNYEKMVSGSKTATKRPAEDTDQPESSSSSDQTDLPEAKKARTEDIKDSEAKAATTKTEEQPESS